MGLSDEERMRNIINCVDDLTDIEPFTFDPNNSLPTKINEIINSLWHSLFGSEGDSIYWFAGSSSDRNTLKYNDVFGLANILSSSKDWELSEEESSMQKLIGDSMNGEDKAWYEYSDLYKPTALSLLKQKESWGVRRYMCHDILVMYKIIEAYFYNVNRYDDNFSKSLEPLTQKISQLKGLCFKVMSKNTIFWKAYASGIVFDSILTPHSDDINKWFMNENMHHSIRLDKIDSKELFKALALAQKIQHNRSFEKMKANDRIALILKFCGSRFHYKHCHEKLFKVIEKHNIDFPKDQINLKQIKDLCDKAFKEHEISDKQNLVNDTWSCDLTGENFYKNDKKFQNRIKNNKCK